MSDTTADRIRTLLHEHTDGLNGEGTKGWPERHREVYALAVDEAAERIAWTPAVRTALAAILAEADPAALLAALTDAGELSHTTMHAQNGTWKSLSTPLERVTGDG